MLFLAVAFLACVASGSELQVLLEGCAPDCEARVTLWDARGNSEVFLSLSDGLVPLPSATREGLRWLLVCSRHALYPEVQLVFRSDLSLESCNVEGAELSKRAENACVVPRLPAVPETSTAFSWLALFSSPMVAVGGASVMMMLVLQLLIRLMGNVDDIRRELRADQKETNKKKNIKIS
jgi:hypothetical protein